MCMVCLSLLGLLEWISLCVVGRQQKCVSYSSGRWKNISMHTQIWGQMQVWSLVHRQLCVHCIFIWQRKWGALGGPFHEGTAMMNWSSLSPPIRTNTITLGIRVPILEFCGDVSSLQPPPYLQHLPLSIFSTRVVRLLQPQNLGWHIVII